jgi:uncharacterized protein (DUF2267 family)
VAAFAVVTVARARGRAATGPTGRDAWVPGAGPDPGTADVRLADRIRSTLGPLEHRLDVPRVHVMAVGHHVLLHGDVATEEQASAIEDAVRRIPGVAGVESYLHVGLLPSDTVPSSEQEPPVSSARRRLDRAARSCGAHGRPAEVAMRATVTSLLQHLPDAERDHVAGHLPADVRAIVEPRRRRTWRAPRPSDRDLVAEVVELSGLEPTTARATAVAVLAELAALVPEEVADVTAVLPARERRLWEHALTHVGEGAP